MEGQNNGPDAGQNEGNGSPEPGSDEYNAAMAAKADQAANPNSANQDQNSDDQALLAGKYKSEEELQKGILNKAGVESLEDLYKALEKGSLDNKGGDDAGKAGADKDGADADTGDKTTIPEPTDNVLDDVQKEFEANGELSEDTLKRLDDAKIPRNLVDLAMAGLKSQQNAENQKVFDAVGGEEKWEAMSDWAGKNLEKSEVEALNDALGGESAYLRNLALKDLAARYDADNPQAPQNKLEGATGADLGVSGFANTAEMTKAMADPRYQKDAKYRDEVMVKVSKSKF